MSSRSGEQRTLFHNHIKNILWLCGSSYIGQINLLIDQAFTGALGAEYLHFHIYMTGLGMVAFALGRALANAVLVTSGKESLKYISSGMTIGVIFAACAALLMLVFKGHALSMSSLPKSVLNGYYLMFVAIGFCEIIKVVTSSAMLRLRLNHKFVHLALLSLSINIIVSLTAFTLTQDPYQRFMCIGFATLLATLMPLLCSLFWVRQRIALTWTLSQEHVRRIARSFRGEGMHILALGHLPLVTIEILQHFYGSDAVNVYGVAQNATRLVMSPWFVSVTQTVKDITDHFSDKSKRKELLRVAQKSVWFLAGIPLLILIVALAAQQGYQKMELLLLAITLPARQLFQISIHNHLVLNRVHERSENTAILEILWSGIVCCFVLWAGAVLQVRNMGILLGFLLSGWGFAWSMKRQNVNELV